jgi:hypothetical protein
MDHKLACVNVHWIRDPAGTSSSYSFHLEELITHLLNDANGVRAFRGAIKNILGYGSDTRLQNLRDVLDEYRRKVLAQKEAGAAEETQGDGESYAPPERPRRDEDSATTQTNGGYHANKPRGLWLQARKDVRSPRPRCKKNRRPSHGHDHDPNGGRRGTKEGESRSTSLPQVSAQDG